jgi:hypothetical protein
MKVFEFLVEEQAVVAARTMSGKLEVKKKKKKKKEEKER